MSILMEELYYEKGIVSSNNVSVHSAFICMLHLANEKGLSFDPKDGKQSKEGQNAIEADFKISLAKSDKAS